MRRLLLCAALLCVSFCAKAQTVNGDMNDDGILTIQDVTQLVNAILSQGGSISIDDDCAVRPQYSIYRTWYATDGSSFTLNEDGTTTRDGASTFVYCKEHSVILFFDANHKFVEADIVDDLQQNSLTLLGCGQDVATTYYDAVYVTGITLSCESLSLKVGETATLSATVLPDYATNKDVSWGSSDTKIATVSESGVVTAVDAGTVTITACAAGGSFVSASATITVKELHDYVDLGLPSGTLWATCNIGAENPEDYGDYYAWGEVETKSDYTYSTAVDCVYGNDGNSDSNWERFNSKNRSIIGTDYDVATVKWGDKWCMPAPTQTQELLDNTTQEWIEGYNGTEINGMLVTSKINGESIFFPAAGDMFNTNLNYPQKIGMYWTGKLSTANDLYDNSISVSEFAFGYNETENEKEIYANGGVTLGLPRYYGETVRAVRSNVDTREFVSSVLLYDTDYNTLPSDTTIAQGKYLYFINEASNPTADNRNLVCSSSDESVATVVKYNPGNRTGWKIKGVAPGTATITVTAADGGGASASVVVTVVDCIKFTSLSFSETKYSFTKSGIVSLTTLPSDASGTVTYTSSNTNVATVDNSGYVTVVAPGLVTITATANDGSGLTATCQVVCGTITPTVTYQYDSEGYLSYYVEGFLPDDDENYFVSYYTDSEWGDLNGTTILTLGHLCHRSFVNSHTNPNGTLNMNITPLQIVWANFYGNDGAVSYPTEDWIYDPDQGWYNDYKIECYINSKLSSTAGMSWLRTADADRMNNN